MSERLIHLLRGRPADGAADAELLARWADRRDEAAFELLLRRHAEPVWRTCRAVAGDAAEDAFQATFLALARRAGAVRGNLPGWLHRVARHAGLRARRPAGPAVPDVPAPDVRPNRTYEELHEELARLPDAYRLPILLCHLHGRTQAEAAKELRLPLGTVATRVRRGCDRLRTALVRRGFEPAVSFGPPLVVPTSLLSASLGIGLGATAAPPAVHTLAHGAASAMSRTKLKLLTAVALVSTAVGGGALVARHPAPDPQPPAPAPKAEGKPADYFDRRDGQERLKSVMLAWHNFEGAGGKLPRDIAGPDGKPLLSWRVAVLPYLEEGYLYEQFKLNEPWDSPHNKPLARYVPKAYRSPGAGPGQTRVKFFRGPGTALDPAKPLTFADFTDGTSNTFGAVDAGPAVDWTRPGDLDYAKDKLLPDLTGPFPDGFLAGYMDGSVRWIDRRYPEKTLRLLVERDDATVVDEPNLPPPPKRELTDREKKRAAQWRNQLEIVRGRAELAAAERAALAAAVAKYGPVGLPPLPAADDLDQLEQQLQAMQQMDQAESAVAERLHEVLRKHDPKAADALRAEYQAKFTALYEAWRAKQPKQ